MSDFAVWPDDNQAIIFLELVKMAYGANIRTSRMILLLKKGTDLFSDTPFLMCAQKSVEYKSVPFFLSPFFFEVMRRIAAPMVGGMISATLLTLVVIPAVFLIWKQRGVNTGDAQDA